jgi:hypothetical protein
MMENDNGVLISNGGCSVRLTQAGQAVEWDYPTIIDVRAGTFHGVVRDDMFDFGSFRAQLISLHQSLIGEATLFTDDGTEVRLTGNGKGSVEVRVKIVQWHSPSIQMTFDFDSDQTYLPAIIEQIELEFPPPYREVKPVVRTTSSQTSSPLRLITALLRRLRAMLSHAQ